MLVNEALEKILSNLNALNLGEKIPLNEAYGRILSEDVIAVKNLPCFDNSALDGYAVRYDKKDKPYKMIDCVFAGDKRTTGIKDNECIKIMTGAKMPLGADTVMRFEDCLVDGDLVYAPENLRKGDAHRFAGEEVKAGEILIKKGTLLNTRAVMMLAAQGISFVSVCIKSRIGIYSSGDELKEPWQSADNDEIYNANALGVAAILRSAGLESSYLGIIKDDLEATKKAFSQISKFDVIVCSGGASKGEADFMKSALISLGFEELFEKINLRPGGPCKAYVKDTKIVFILPGNPMAAYLCAYLLILPALLGKQHEKQLVRISENLKLKSGRSNVVFGTIEGDKFYVTDHNKYGSGMIKPLLKSNAIYLSDPNESEILENSEIFAIRLP